MKNYRDIILKRNFEDELNRISKLLKEKTKRS
jgi:hypothetical protein